MKCAAIRNMGRGLPLSRALVRFVATVVEARRETPVPSAKVAENAVLDDGGVAFVGVSVPVSAVQGQATRVRVG